jgi:hypothetical protein
MLTGVWRSAGNLRSGSAEARCWGWLGDVGDLNESAPVFQMRMLWGFNHTQHRCEAYIGALHHFTPLLTSLGLENLCHAILECRPSSSVHLIGKRFTFHPGELDEQIVELGFNRTDRDVLTVATFVGLIEGGSGIQ